MQNKGLKAIEISKLSVRYAKRKGMVLEDVTFSVVSGSITTLIGPNGSGKTTLIKAILGLLEFDGEVLVFGKPVSESYKKIGFVPQRFTFDEEFPVNVYEFVSMPLRVKKLTSKRLDSIVLDVLRNVGIEKVKSQLLSELSGGQLQRSLLARALVTKPKLLILDEPEAGVDVGGEQTLYDLLKKLVKSEKITVLVASHELDVVYTYADNVVCINRKVVCKGKPYEVLNQEMFEALYGRELKFYGHEHH